MPFHNKYTHTVVRYRKGKKATTSFHKGPTLTEVIDKAGVNNWRCQRLEHNVWHFNNRGEQVFIMRHRIP